MFKISGKNLRGVYVGLTALFACVEVKAEAPSNIELIKILVDKGVISVEEAKKIIADENAKKAPDDSTLRVTHVPESVREDIAQKVREGVKQDVASEVISKAKTEGWGIAGAQPDWLRSIKLSGDFRLRAQEDLFGSGNVEASVIDYQVANEKHSDLNASINTIDDRARLRNRLRLQLDAKVNDAIDFHTRLATGNALDPVSTNQTLGSYGEKQAIAVDQAFAEGHFLSNQLGVKVGRMPSPFSATDLVWDSDLAFEGIAGAWTISPKKSDERGMPGTLLAGVFPIQEIELSSQDKWLYALEAGFNWVQINNNRFHAAIGYYAFDNISGEKNILDSKLTDFTAPKNMQRGNSVFNIRNSRAPSSADELFALASGFNDLDLTLTYDVALGNSKHLMLTADYVKNLGYDTEKVSARVDKTNYEAQVDCYKFEVVWGVPKPSKPGDWNAGFAYRHLERDAVLDAFTDSDFLQGGTDNKGYVLSGEYAVLNNTSIKLNFLSASSINPVAKSEAANSKTAKAIDFDSDSVQLDLNVKF
jgi:Putative porin